MRRVGRLTDRAAEEGGYRFTIPLGRRGIWLMILPPILITLVAMCFSGPEYFFKSEPALLSGTLACLVVSRLRKRGYLRAS